MFCLVIAGGTGSGKSTLARALCADLGETALLIAHDWYYRDLSHLPLSARELSNFDEPAALDTDLLLEQLQQLRAGHTVQAPQYDFVRHMRTKVSLTLRPHTFVVVEGVLALSDPGLRAACDLSVFVDAPADLRLIRRLRRDLTDRGRTVESVLLQWERHVRPMHERHVAPARAGADIVVSGDAPIEGSVQEILARARA